MRADFAQPPPLAGPNGDRRWVNVSGYVQMTGTAVITKNCANPEAAMRYIDDWYSLEGTVILRMGIEGVTYRIDESGERSFLDFVTKNPDGLSMDEVLGKYALYGGGHVPQYIVDASDKGTIKQPDAIRAQAAVRDALIDIRSLPNLHFTQEEVLRLRRYSAALIECVEENAVCFITGERDIAEWDEYLAQIEAAGLQECLSAYQAAFDRWLAL